MGLLPGVSAGDWFAWTADPRDDFEPRPDEEEDADAWIRETVNGIQMRRDPEAALRDSPHLWGIVALFYSCPDLTLSVRDFERMPNFAVVAFNIARAAQLREDIRRARARDEDELEGEAAA